VNEFRRPSPFAPKSKAVKDKHAAREWALKQDCCVNCGRRDNLSVHHIIGGRGGRSDEPCNMLCLCMPCHDLAEDRDVRGPDGELLPKLTEGNCLWLKMTYNPKEYDAERLQEMKRCRLDDPEEPARLPRLP